MSALIGHSLGTHWALFAEATVSASKYKRSVLHTKSSALCEDTIAGERTLKRENENIMKMREAGLLEVTGQSLAA